MVIKTYISKNNTIIFNELTNTARNPVTEIFYGGSVSSPKYSRFLFFFDETRLRDLYTGGTFTDLTKLKHTIKMTNTGLFDTQLLNGTTADGKERTTSFDLVIFKINQIWDEGTGFDFNNTTTIGDNQSFSVSPSNWIEPRNMETWNNGSGVYSGSVTGITVATQHFDKGNENIEMDITDYVNGLLTGDTNYGLGLAYNRPFEETPAADFQYVGFFTRNTQTFYEPYVETIYNQHIKDDRNNFYLDKLNKLYLYVNLAGNPTNLDSIPSVNVYDNDDVLFSAYTPTAVTHITKGVYSIDILVPTTTAFTDCSMFTDVWSGVTINGVNRPLIELDFGLKDSSSYYEIGSNDQLPKKAGFSVSGLKRGERIKRGDIRKVIISSRIPYTVEQTQNIDKLEYRIYVKEGKSELTVINYQPVELSNNNYFLLDTNSLIPNIYYLDLKMFSNLEVTTINDVISFEITSQSDFRESQ